MNHTIRKFKAPLIAILGFVFLPISVFASTSISDDFESYSDGSLNGKNGGSGFTGAWVTSGFTVQGTTVNGGSKAVTDPSGEYASRAFGDQTVGSISVYARYHTYSGLGFKLYNSGGTMAATIYCNASSQWSYYNGSGYSNYSGCQADTWYKITIAWDNPNHPNQVTYSIDDGTPTDWQTVVGSSYTYISSLRIANGGDWIGYSYWDDISGTVGTDEEPPAGETVVATGEQIGDLLLLYFWTMMTVLSLILLFVPIAMVGIRNVIRFFPN